MTFDAETFARIATDLYDAHDVVGFSAAVRCGTEVLQTSGGIASVRTHTPVTPATRFQIGSITKVYTATLVMALVEEGLVALDAPVTRYLPALKASDDDLTDVTVAHLLTHTGGLQGDVLEDFGRNDDAIERLVAALADLPKDFPTGMQFSYCNAGWVVLGRIAEVVTGTPWATALEDRVLRPGGLSETHTLTEEVILHPHAVGHMAGPDGPAVAPVWTLGFANAPAGALTVATVADLLAFARLHTDGGTAPDGTRVLQADTVTAMQQPRVTLPGGGGLADHWGLGWFLMDWSRADGTGTVRAIGHDGGTIGQHAHLRVVPEADVAVSVLTNGGGSSPRFAERLMAATLREAAGVAMPPDPAAPDPRVVIDPATVCGTYRRHGMEITIRAGADDGFLVDVVPLGAGAALQPPMRDLPAVALGEGRLLVSVMSLSLPLACYEGQGTRWAFFGGRANRRVG